MLPENRKHIVSVMLWGGGLSAATAVACLFAFSPIIAFSVVLGAALSVANVYSIVLVVEALTVSAKAGNMPTGTGKAVAGFIHALKLLLVTALLVTLVVMRLVNPFGLLAGFTFVLAAHVLTGMKRMAGDTDDAG